MNSRFSPAIYCGVHIRTNSTLKKGLTVTLALLLTPTTLTAAGEPAGKLLGDISDGSRAQTYHRIPLLYENEDGERGEKIAPDDEILLPFSTRWTCGDCHSYSIISKGWHFNAVDSNVVPGRPGQPWIFVDAGIATQVPLSYRPWPGTFKPEQFGLTAREFTRLFGYSSPGGGAGELESQDLDEIMREFVSGRLEINCLSCHDVDPAHNQGEYAIQTAMENFRWAAASTCSFASVKGSTKDLLDAKEYYDPFLPGPLKDSKLVPPTIAYREVAFDHKNEVFFDVPREVPDHRCYFCHSNLYFDRKDAEKWSSDEDVHLTAGLTCVDCHRNGLDHNITRGYEEEAWISRNQLAATSSCQGCHLGEDSSVPEGGRLGAPVPEHPGIPPIHFEKLTCTACHSGPWPVKETVLTKTSRAHRLGTSNVNKAQRVLPHIIAPIFARQRPPIVAYLGEALTLLDSKIAPHKLIWPAFWGTMKDDKVSPVDLETVRRTVGEVFSQIELPASGGWPKLSKENITKGLTALGKEIKGQPVYIAGGNLYRLAASGKLYSLWDHPAAQPYLWPIAHDVRPAAQSLGVRRCEDCHATDAPFFFGEVTIDSPLAAERGSTRKMIEFQDIDAFYARLFAFSFVFRTWLKVVALASCAVLAAVLILYVLKALACLVKVLAEED